jgi:ribonuclease I
MLSNHQPYYAFGLTRCDTEHNFTIHGLWPENKEFCSNEKFNISLIQDLQNEMNIKWFSCYGNNTEFWNHEWSKHGTCTNFTQHQYFEKSLSIYDNIISNNYIKYCKSDEKECELYLNKDFKLIPKNFV